MRKYEFGGRKFIPWFNVSSDENESLAIGGIYYGGRDAWYVYSDGRIGCVGLVLMNRSRLIIGYLLQ